MDKTYRSTDDAVADIADGASLVVGGIGVCGIPLRLIEALYTQGATDLRTVSNNCGVNDARLGMLTASRISSVVASYIGDNHEFARQYLSGELELELCPKGLLPRGCVQAASASPGFTHPPVSARWWSMAVPGGRHGGPGIRTQGDSLVP